MPADNRMSTSGGRDDVRAETFYSSTVGHDWLDALDHVNFLEYQRAADKATDQFWYAVGGAPATDADATLSLVIIETHVRYLRELRLGDPVEVRTRIVGFDARRLHLEHALLRRDELSCTIQVLALAFDRGARAAGHWPEAMLRAFAGRCEQPQATRVPGFARDSLGADPRTAGPR